jgi:ATPase components of ABC transporters with duplicated ATPase domains
MNRVGTLSGGEQARLQIATLILSGANLLILDEPTNNLDIPSVEALETALLDFPGAILTISHDRYFLDRSCTRTIEIQDGIVRDFPGGYSYYLDHPDRGTPLTRRLQFRKEACPRQARSAGRPVCSRSQLAARNRPCQRNQRNTGIMSS